MVGKFIALATRVLRKAQWELRGAKEIVLIMVEVRGIESKRGICDEPRRNVENKVKEIRPCVLNYSPKQYVKVLTSDPVNMTLFGSRVFANVIKM